MSYRNKYLKYKNKYLSLKEMIGGKRKSNRFQPKYTVTTHLDRLFKVGTGTTFEFDDLFTEEELVTLVGEDEKDILLEHFNNNINKTSIIAVFNDSLPPEHIPLRDENPRMKTIFNQRDLSKVDLVKLFYNLSPNTLLSNRHMNSRKFLDEDTLNEKLIAMINLYKPNIDDQGKYYDNKIAFPSTGTFTDLRINVDVYYAQKITIPDDSEIHFIGDIHGSLMSLIKLIVKDMGEIINDDLTLKPKNYLIFTGDIVDYSQLGLECLYLISLLKLKNPSKVFICDGNNEDYDQYTQGSIPTKYLKGEIDSEITNPIIKTNVHRLLKIFPTVIFVNFNENLFQFNHGSHPLVKLTSDMSRVSLGTHLGNNRNYKTANTFQLKEYLESDKEFLLMSFGVDYPIRKYAGYEFKWGDFSQRYTGSISYARPQRTLKDTQDYLTELNIQCIFTGHQDVAPLSILANRLIDGTDDAFKDKKHNYELTVGYYNLLGFPPIKELGYRNWKGVKFIVDNRINPSNSTGTAIRNKYVNLPDEQKYKFVFNPSKLNKANTTLDKPNRILAMTQSTAGMSHGKLINYTSYSTLKSN